jgi:hypothetical protein
MAASNSTDSNQCAIMMSSSNSNSCHSNQCAWLTMSSNSISNSSSGQQLMYYQP